MELLILKTGDRYIRIKADGPHIVPLDKASVFPMNQLEKVKAHQQNLCDAAGFENVYIKKLILTEEDL